MEAWRMTMNLKTPQKGTRAQKMGGSADNLRCSDRSRPQGQEASQQLCTMHRQCGFQSHNNV